MKCVELLLPTLLLFIRKTLENYNSNQGRKQSLSVLHYRVYLVLTYNLHHADNCPNIKINLCWDLPVVIHCYLI